MSAQEGGPKLCGDALAVRGDYIVTGSLLPENSLELWSIKVQHFMVCVCVCVLACVCVCVIIIGHSVVTNTMVTLVTNPPPLGGKVNGHSAL